MPGSPLRRWDLWMGWRGRKQPAESPSIHRVTRPEGHRSDNPQHHSPLFLPQLQGLLTLFAKSFASFNRSTCALSVPCWYSALRWIHIALQTAVPSHSTPGCKQQRLQQPPRTESVWDSIPLWWPLPGSLPGARSLMALPPAPQPTASAEIHESRIGIQCGLSLCCQFTRRYWSNRCCLLFLH